MAETSTIEWTDATWNPITGCTLVDDGCRNCYAAELAAGRLKAHPSRHGLAVRNAQGVAKFTGQLRWNNQWADQPLRWRKPRMIFVCAHGDLFHEDVPTVWIDRVFSVMVLAPRHTFQVLTKRPDRAARYFARDDDGFMAAEARIEHRAKQIARDRKTPVPIGKTLLGTAPWPHIWLGTSASDQASAEARVPALLGTPAATHFVSAEPLLGPVDLASMCDDGAYDALIGFDAKGSGHIFKGLDWVICGGESGRRARPMHPDWARSLRDQCAAAQVPFFFKQWGTWLPQCQDPDGRWDWAEADERGILHHWPEDREHKTSMPLSKSTAGRLLDGIEHNEVPE